MKASHRKDVILARLVFAIFILAIVAVVYTIGAKLISSHKKQAADVAQIESSEAQQAADSWKIPELQTEDTEAVVTENTVVYMTTTASVNLRAAAGTDSDSLAKLPTGTQVTLLSRGDDGWNQVDYNGTTGYIKADYLEQSGTATVNENGDTVTMVKTNADVNMRSGPSTDDSKIASVPSGTELESTGEEDGWTKVTYEGQEGYIRSDFIDAE